MTNIHSVTGFQGVLMALVSALLFAACTPVSKLLLGSMEPVTLAGMLYLGSGVGLSLFQALAGGWKPENGTRLGLERGELGWLAAAIFCGGVVGPVLLLLGLKSTDASVASLLLNFEAVLTAALAWLIFHENYERRLVVGMLCITGGTMVLSFIGTKSGGSILGAVFILGACLAWALDNNLTRKVSAGDAVEIARIKGLVSGGVNLFLAICMGAALPGAGMAALAMLVGFVGYGASLTLFVMALRHIGAARTSAYFSLSPFAGAILSILIFKNPVTSTFVAAAALCGFGVWLHLTERHEHSHRHDFIEHEHSHVHDEHHQHAHENGQPSNEPHNHVHIHEQLIHTHRHYPDIHHHHDH
jgi:drug/metabolite transporter (DMT)-like permease